MSALKANCTAPSCRRPARLADCCHIIFMTSVFATFRIQIGYARSINARIILNKQIRVATAALPNSTNFFLSAVVCSYDTIQNETIASSLPYLYATYEILSRLYFQITIRLNSVDSKFSRFRIHQIYNN